MTLPNQSIVNDKHEKIVELDNLFSLKEKLSNTDNGHSQIIAQKANFFIPKCFACKNEIQFTEGDIIFGERWYHNSCWDEKQKTVLVDNTKSFL